MKLKKELSGQQIQQAKHKILSELMTAGIDVEEFSRVTLSMEDIFFRATEARG